MVARMEESRLQAHIYARSEHLGGDVLVGPGDDCAVVRIGESLALLTTDQLVEDRHYRRADPLDWIARKAVARSMSDIGAMGGRATCMLAAATLRSDFQQADELFDAMATWALRWSCPLVGGDIAIGDGPTVLTTTVVGTPHLSRGPVLRSQARPGDLVCVTGELGGSFESGRHFHFEPRIEDASWLCDEFGDDLGAMIDLSDGLGRDAGRMARASGVRFEVDAMRLPVAPDATWRQALSDGEDYELCFTLRGEAPSHTSIGTPITVIGAVRDGEGCMVRTPEGEMLDASELGWDHRS